MYGNAHHERVHRGNDPLDSVRIAMYQRRLRTVWKASDVEATGMHEGATVEAVGAVQRAYGLPVTGWVDRDTWAALWSAPLPTACT